MNQFDIIAEICVILGKYKAQHVKSFYASSIVDDLKTNGINYDEIGKSVVLTLNSLVNQGKLKRKYIIFNPENLSEKRVYDNLSQIPKDDYINFDFNNVYIESSSSPLIETFFVFPKNDNDKYYPKSKSPQIIKN